MGVPGTVGGAVRMNAGGHGSDTVATLVSYRVVDLVHRPGPTDRPAGDLGAAYRRYRVAATDVVVSATHRLEPGDPEAGRAAIDEIVRWRRANQPGGVQRRVGVHQPGRRLGRPPDRRRAD